MYCEQSTRRIVAVCNNNDVVRECVKCYANIAKDGGSPTCSGFTCTNYSILSSYPSNPDSYDINGTIEGSTEECSFTDSTNFLSLCILLVCMIVSVVIKKFYE